MHTIAWTTLACMSMCEMQNGIYEVAVTGIVIMNMQEKALNTYCWMENNTRISAKYTPSYVRQILGVTQGQYKTVHISGSWKFTLREIWKWKWYLVPRQIKYSWPVYRQLSHRLGGGILHNFPSSSWNWLFHCRGCYLSFAEEWLVHWVHGSGGQRTPRLSALCEITCKGVGISPNDLNKYIDLHCFV